MDPSAQFESLFSSSKIGHLFLGHRVYAHTQAAPIGALSNGWQACAPGKAFSYTCIRLAHLWKKGGSMRRIASWQGGFQTGKNGKDTQLHTCRTSLERERERERDLHVNYYWHKRGKHSARNKIVSQLLVPVRCIEVNPWPFDCVRNYLHCSSV